MRLDRIYDAVENYNFFIRNGGGTIILILMCKMVIFIGFEKFI